MIYQKLDTSDGMMFLLILPEAGRRQRQRLGTRTSRKLCNERYNILLIRGFRLHVAVMDTRTLFAQYTDVDEMVFQNMTSAVLVLVEHNYKDLKKYWIGQNFHRKIKVRKAPIEPL